MSTARERIAWLARVLVIGTLFGVLLFAAYLLLAMV